MAVIIGTREIGPEYNDSDREERSLPQDALKRIATELKERIILDAKNNGQRVELAEICEQIKALPPLDTRESPVSNEKFDNLTGRFCLSLRQDLEALTLLINPEVLMSSKHSLQHLIQYFSDQCGNASVPNDDFCFLAKHGTPESEAQMAQIRWITCNVMGCASDGDHV